MQRPRVLLAIHLDSFFTGLIHVARLLKASGRFEPVFLFAQRYPTVDRDIAVCHREGMVVLGEDPGAAAAEAPRSSPLRAVTKRVLQKVSPELPDRLYGRMQMSLPVQLRRLRARLHSLRKLLVDESISLVVLGGDIAHYDTAVYVRAAHDVGIRALIVAGWMIHQNENAEAFYFDSSLFTKRWPNRLMSFFAPRWSYRYKDREFVRLPAGAALARELMGIAPPRPWTLHSGFADRIAVDSGATFDACIREGLPREQVVITGAIVHDVLFENSQNATQRRQELARRLGFPDPTLPMILCTLPPNELLRVGGRPECDFSSYEEIARFYFQSLAEIRGWNSVVSLHPSQKREIVEPLEQPQVKLATYPHFHTAELVPLCDLFVTSGSSTIQWATACGKPIINYDVYRYRQFDYDGIAGMRRTEEQSGFRELLMQTTNGGPLLGRMAEEQSQQRDQWGKLDGHAGDRMMAVMDELIALGRAPRTQHG